MHISIDTYPYTLLDRIVATIVPSDWDNVIVCACQHLLGPQFEMFQRLVASGLPVDRIFVCDKVYSTNQDVAEKLRQMGVKVLFEKFPFAGSYDYYHSHMCRQLIDRVLEKATPTSKVIMLDDGGQLLAAAIENIARFGSCKIYGIEQTSSGFRKLEHYENIPFPIVNVARSQIKLQNESPYIAQLIIERSCAAIKYYEIRNPRILVVGAGPLGLCVIHQLQTLGHSVTVADSPESFTTIITDSSARYNVIIGMTGASILNKDAIDQYLELVAEQVIFISGSSSDREFSAHELWSTESQINIHADCFHKNGILINNGFPITFYGNYCESKPSEIEPTIGLLLGSLRDCVHGLDNTVSGFVEVSETTRNICEI